MQQLDLPEWVQTISASWAWVGSPWGVQKNLPGEVNIGRVTNDNYRLLIVGPDRRIQNRYAETLAEAPEQIRQLIAELDRVMRAQRILSDQLRQKTLECEKLRLALQGLAAAEAPALESGEDD